MNEEFFKALAEIIEPSKEEKAKELVTFINILNPLLEASANDSFEVIHKQCSREIEKLISERAESLGIVHRNETEVLMAMLCEAINDYNSKAHAAFVKRPQGYELIYDENNWSDMTTAFATGYANRLGLRFDKVKVPTSGKPVSRNMSTAEENAHFHKLMEELFANKSK